MGGTTDCQVSGALAAILLVSRFGGVAPLRFVRNNTGWRVSLSTGWSIYGYLIITIINIMNIVILIFELQQDQSKSVLMRTNTGGVVLILRLGLAMVVSSVVVHKAPGQMRFIIKCLNHVQKINSELNTHRRPMLSEKKKICLILFWMIICMTVNCIDYQLLLYISDLINGKKSMRWMYWLFYSSSWIVQLQMMLFSMITLDVMYIYKALNHHLRTMLNDDVTKMVRYQHKTVRRLSLAYVSACDVVREVDRSNGLTALMILALFILNLLVSAYYFVKDILEVNIFKNTTMRVTNIAIQLIWCIVHFINIVIAIEPCHLTHMEIETTRELVSKLIQSQSIYKPLEMELDLFVRYLLLNKPTYSPLKVTTISRSLLAASLSIITTYLVIIIQL